MAKLDGPQGTSPGVFTQIANGAKDLGSKVGELVGKLASGRTVFKSDSEPLPVCDDYQSQPEATELSSYQVEMKYSEPHSQDYYDREYDELWNRPLGSAFEQDDNLLADVVGYEHAAEEARNSAIGAYKTRREQTLKAREESFNKRQAQSRLDILSKEFEQDAKNPVDSLFDSTKGGLMGEIETEMESRTLERQLEMERNKQQMERNKQPEDLRNEIRAKGAARDTFVAGEDGLIYENRYAAATAPLDAKQAGFSSSVDGDKFTLTGAGAAKYREMVAYEQLGEKVDIVAQLRDKEQRWEAKAKKLSDYFAKMRKNHTKLYYATGFAAINVISNVLIKKLQSRIAKRLGSANHELYLARLHVKQFDSYKTERKAYVQEQAANRQPIKVDREDGWHEVHPVDKTAGSRRAKKKRRSKKPATEGQGIRANDTRTDDQRRADTVRDRLRTQLKEENQGLREKVANTYHWLLDTEGPKAQRDGTRAS